MAYLQMNLDAGNYTVSMFYSGDLNYAPTNKSFDINIYQISTKLSVKSVKILRGNYYVVTLTDTSGNVLANRTVTFTVNGRTYTRNTGSLGTASLRLTLKAGTYSIKTISPAADGFHLYQLCLRRGGPCRVLTAASICVPGCTADIPGYDFEIHRREIW